MLRKDELPSSGTSRPCLLVAPIESTVVQHPCRPARAAGLGGSDEELLEAAADCSDGSIGPSAERRISQAGIGPGGWTCFINVSSHSPSTTTWANAPNSTASIRLWVR